MHHAICSFIGAAHFLPRRRSAAHHRPLAL
jgi:hypothetical protein